MQSRWDGNPAPKVRSTKRDGLGLFPIPNYSLFLLRVLPNFEPLFTGRFKISESFPITRQQRDVDFEIDAFKLHFKQGCIVLSRLEPSPTDMWGADLVACQRVLVAR